MKGIRLLLKEIADFRRFYREASDAARMIVFYAEHEGYWPYFEGIIAELTSRHGREICYVTSDPDDPVLKEPGAGIKAFYLNILLPFFMAFVNSKVFVMTLTDLNQYYLKRSINPVNYVYVFHSLVSIHMAYRYGAFDHYDSILCCGPHHNKEIRKYEELNSLMPKKLVNAGYYRLERIYNAHKKRNIQKSASDKKKTILIAPSWGIDNVLESCGERLVELLLGADYEVIVRPHPETVKRSPDLMASFKIRFGNNPDFILETSVATDDSLLRSDLLICDCSGIALEYAFGTERPVLFIDVPIKINNKRYRELNIEPMELSLRSKIGVIIPPDELNKIPNIVSNLIKKHDDYKEQINDLRRNIVYAFGNSSETGADYIIDLIKGNAGEGSMTHKERITA